jgi:hypothetical protein
MRGSSRPTPSPTSSSSSSGRSRNTTRSSILWCAKEQAPWRQHRRTADSSQASSASGEERRKLYQELWQTAYDNYWVLPLLGLDYVHGSSAKVVWTPRIDNNWLFVEMQLQD